MAEQNSRPIVILSHTSAARCGAAAITSHSRCPQFRPAIQNGGIGFDRAVASNGTATAVASLAPLCYLSCELWQNYVHSRLIVSMRSDRVGFSPLLMYFGSRYQSCQPSMRQKRLK